MRIAYLNSEYPSLSHTFIEREVRQLRALGVDITTFSVRPLGRTATLGSAHAQAARETRVILRSPGTLMGALVRASLTRPLALVRALAAGQRMSPPGLRARLWHIAYAIEGIRLAQMLRAERLDHVHVHMANNGAAIARLATRFDPTLTYSMSIHGSAEFFHVDSWALAHKARDARFIRCISNFCRAQVMIFTDPSRWSDLHVVRCGIDTDQFRPTATPPPDDPLRLVTVGRLHPIKGYTVLLQALAGLRDRGVAFHLTMIGDGPMRATIERTIRDLDLVDRVTLAGAVAAEDLVRYLHDAHAMVVSSFMEGVPVVLMEAMACELAVIATRVGGIPELVEDGVSGLLVDPASSASLAQAIESLAQNAEKRRCLGRAARRVVCDRYDIRGSAAQMREIFGRYLSEALASGMSEPSSQTRTSVVTQP